MTSAPHLLIVEDEEFVLNLLAAYLEKEGFRISRATTGASMMTQLNRANFDAILLDLNLPDEDGLALARMVRMRSAVPIFVLTARMARDDRLSALQIGADDYLTKPVDPEELVLRLRNRLKLGEVAATAPNDGDIRFEGWRLSPFGHTLTAPDGSDVALTPAEFNLLLALARAPGRALSRAHLLDAISRSVETPSERLIDVLISRLRHKIEADRSNPRLIITVSGIGYKFTGHTT